MCGMMGLVVDLGWSFFVEKQSQAAADGAALAAVQEAVAHIRSGGGSVTGTPCGGSSPYCTDVSGINPLSCSSGTITGTNLREQVANTP